MCGIAGIASTHILDTHDCDRRLQRMLDTTRHRGPDDQGRLNRSDIALGHNRLSIIDLSSEGRQPMTNETDTLYVVFNGEIYNFQQLKAELEASGHSFQSKTDTEILVHGYEEWGIEGLLARIEGMFAFALWDSTKKALFLARDPFGIKPLYYSYDKQELVFASEMKAITAQLDNAPRVNSEGLLLSLQHIGVPAPFTINQDIHQLEPGEWLTFNQNNGKVSKQRYWTWRPHPDPSIADSAHSHLWEKICSSVEQQLIADVPVGIFLSGGLDSSLIAAACAELGKKPTCLTIALRDSNRDESRYAAALCTYYGLPHQIEPMDADAGRPFDERLGEMFDEPFPSSAALSSAYLCQIAARDFKVMLSGEGGDELFGGYSWYSNWLEWYGQKGTPVALWRHPKNALRAALGRSFQPIEPMDGYAQYMGAFSPQEMIGLFQKDLIECHPIAADGGKFYSQLDDPTLDSFNRLQHLDMQLFLPSVCLRKMDITSMAHSLEVRVPFLDRSIAEYVAALPIETRNPSLEKKGIIKALAINKLPKKILGKRKQGFSTPIRRWFPSQDIINAITQDASTDDWWHEVFDTKAFRTVSRLRGRSLWRFWHTWQWLKRRRSALTHGNLLA